MRTSQYSTAALIDLFRQQTVATLAEVMTALGTGARRTAFRKLKEIPYRASYSHRGRYYTLDELIDGPEQQKSPPKSAFVLAPALSCQQICSQEPRTRSDLPRRLREHCLTHDDSLYECRAHEDDPFTDTCGPPWKGLGRS